MIGNLMIVAVFIAIVGGFLWWCWWCLGWGGFVFGVALLAWVFKWAVANIDPNVHNRSALKRWIKRQLVGNDNDRHYTDKR